MHPAFLYLPGERLSQSELSAARIDGHVVEMGDAYVPADLVEAPDVRASSIAALIRPGTAASHQTAAWVHGAGDAPPAVHHVKRSIDRRIRLGTSSRLVFHDTVLPAADIATVGGIAVSRPVRTMLDLATTLHRDPRVLVWMHRLAIVFPDVADAAADALHELRRVPGSRAGLSALRRVSVRRR
ncbi:MULTISPECIES: type IV toxin-antitoxin system AbiEi family antitoxin [unclassified Microbacterium]|uniref:type IV toxin-antitoxin system AbiEi family antitoxin n=1 Tax=unclassified Microbacterium TaxID=2609290 RepID=UPI001604F7CD|nr:MULTISPECIES: type IV toxin-antitoxin system AbiEi family antitoxin [unclassified Microbacterium]QNA92674.1 hypothetical protein G4G29_10325 [Microbacterium sp. Se63.02b]QYM62804.1 type IV toxin-antitoxin system AbiEi family antitoxin [Microbacterium sp. Se5.02b]